jgi:prepilin-type N-terminal cleavage/methylation domain-containing protein
MRSRRLGFTLLELVLVMAILVILAAIGAPSLLSMRPYYRIQGGTDSLKAAFANARAYAMDTGQPYRLAIIPGKGNFRIAPDSSDFWSGSAPQTADDGTPLQVLEDAVPEGVVLLLDDNADIGDDDDQQTVLSSEGLSPDQWKTVAVLLPDGTAREDARVTLRTPGARPRTVFLRSLTGIVSVEGIQAEDK